MVLMKMIVPVYQETNEPPGWSEEQNKAEDCAGIVAGIYTFHKTATIAHLSLHLLKMPLVPGYSFLQGRPVPVNADSYWTNQLFCEWVFPHEIWYIILTIGSLISI